MAASTLTSYQKSEVCKLGEKTVLILSIDNEIGFNKYTVIDLDSGLIYNAYKHQLSKREEIDIDGPIPEGTMEVENEPKKEESVQEVKEGRFVKKTEEELKEIETHTKAHTTHQQTKWGVKILKGIYILIFNILCTKKNY